MQNELKANLFSFLVLVITSHFFMIGKLEAVDGFLVGTIESQTPVGLGVVIDNPTGECMKVLRVFYRLQPSIRKLITKVYFKCDLSDTKRL